MVSLLYFIKLYYVFLLYILYIYSYVPPISIQSLPKSDPGYCFGDVKARFSAIGRPGSCGGELLVLKLAILLSDIF